MSNTMRGAGSREAWVSNTMRGAGSREARISNTTRPHGPESAFLLRKSLEIFVNATSLVC